jgi:hypothetical protein
MFAEIKPQTGSRLFFNFPGGAGDLSERFLFAFLCLIIRAFDTACT